MLARGIPARIAARPNASADIFPEIPIDHCRPQRVVILRLDGPDCTLTRELLAEGELPHLEALRNHGCFKPLGVKLCLYVLRHTWINHLLTSGVDIPTVAILVGQADLSTLARTYDSLQPGRRRCPGRRFVRDGSAWPSLRGRI
jgi:integrase